MMRCHCRQRRVSTKLPPPPSWLPPALHCHLHAAATYAAATLPAPLRRRRLHTAAAASTPPPTLPLFPASSLLPSLLPFPSSLPSLLFVDCCLFVPPPLLSTPVSSSPPQRSTVAEWQWWRLPRPCPPVLRCRRPACLRRCCATGKLPLPSPPFPPQCFR
jgi:hypothetical protein